METKSGITPGGRLVDGGLGPQRTSLLVYCLIRVCVYSTCRLGLDLTRIS